MRDAATVYRGLIFVIATSYAVSIFLELGYGMLSRIDSQKVTLTFDNFGKFRSIFVINLSL